MMKIFEVVVRVTITKTYTVRADTQEEAIEEVFSSGVDVHCESDVPEDYDEQVLSVTEIKE